MRESTAYYNIMVAHTRAKELGHSAIQVYIYTFVKLMMLGARNLPGLSSPPPIMHMVRAASLSAGSRLSVGGDTNTHTVSVGW